MAQPAPLVAALLMFAGAQASDMEERSTHQRFLSKYGSDAPMASHGDYNKFLLHQVNRMKHGGEPGALSHHNGPAEHGPAMDDSQAVGANEKMLSNYSSTPLGISAIAVSLLTLAAMLGVRMRRGLHQATGFSTSGGHESDMSISLSSLSEDDIVELKAQESTVRIHEEVARSSGYTLRSDNFRTRGWWQHSSTKSCPSTLCYAAEPFGMEATPADDTEATPADDVDATLADYAKAVDDKRLDTWLTAGISGPFGFFDPLNFAVDVAGLPNYSPTNTKASEDRLDRVKYYREAELKHGRVAMLAAFGFPVAEQFHPLFGGNINVPSYIAFQQTPLQTFWPLVLLAVGSCEILSIFAFEDPAEGGWWTLKKNHIPGNYMDISAPSMTSMEKKEMQTKELNNGRLAMIGIAGMVVQELVTGEKLFG